ncbi:MAG: dihydrolipoyl dehydrogenase [Gammaproteobacteria bacterium]|nr:dihydrolipoyl dehydrogenase [Gammaproteobacteria bacterium]
MQQYEVIVVGAGPAGYVCAIRCAQLGLKVACIDKRVDTRGKPKLGGTCLNVGCIPSKALLDSTHHVQFINEQAGTHGLKVSGLEVDVPAMQKRKDHVVRTLVGGVASLLKKNKVDVISGTAGFIAPQKIRVDHAGGASQDLQGKHIVIASGSEPVDIQAAPVDGDCIVDSTGALEFHEVPLRLGIIGAGVIGLEMGSVWSRLGSEVVILEALPEFLAMADQAVSKEAFKILVKQGLDIRLNCKVQEARTSSDKVQVVYSTGNTEQSLEVDKLIVAVGRRPHTEGLNLDDLGIKTDQKGFIEVDSHWETSVKGVYAIGDVIGGAMLAHKGSEEGVALAELLADQSAHVSYESIPWVIYTWPEIAWAGRTERQCKESGIDYRTGVFPFMALGRAHAMGHAEGMFKIVGDASTDRILGVHILGPNASELISEAVVAMESELYTEDLARMIHAHPSLAEGMHEAALAVGGRAIHF